MPTDCPMPNSKSARIAFVRSCLTFGSDVKKTLSHGTLMIALLVLAMGCGKGQQMKTADDIFRAELNKRGIVASKTPKGLYEIHIHGEPLTVSLESVQRNFNRDRNPAAVIEFVDQLITNLPAETPSWNEVRPFVRYCLEPSDYE